MLPHWASHSPWAPDIRYAAEARPLYRVNKNARNRSTGSRDVFVASTVRRASATTACPAGGAFSAEGLSRTPVVHEPFPFHVANSERSDWPGKTRYDGRLVRAALLPVASHEKTVKGLVRHNLTLQYP